MKIHGFQKITMLDFPGKIAATVFTAGCNLRCPFCHNARLVTHLENEDEIREEEIFAYLEKRKGMLEGVCVTGGEPLMQADIAEFLKKIKALGLSVKLDTNGCFPEKLKELVNEGLVDYVAMDIKNSPALYGETVGIDSFSLDKINESKEFLLSGAVDYEFRTTVVAELHNEKGMLELAEWIKGAKNYFLQSFNDSGDIIGEGFSSPSRQFMKETQAVVAHFVEKVELRGI